MTNIYSRFLANTKIAHIFHWISISTKLFSSLQTHRQWVIATQYSVTHFPICHFPGPHEWGIFLLAVDSKRAYVARLSAMQTSAEFGNWRILSALQHSYKMGTKIQFTAHTLLQGHYCGKTAVSLYEEQVPTMCGRECECIWVWCYSLCTYNAYDKSLVSVNKHS